MIVSLLISSNVLGGVAPNAAPLPVWHDTAVRGRPGQLAGPGRGLRGTDPVHRGGVHFGYVLVGVTAFNEAD